MTPFKFARSPENLAFGIFLIFIATTILFFSQSIRVNDFGNHDPGPRVIPIAMAVIMLLGGIVEVVSGFRVVPVPLQPQPQALEQTASNADWKRGLSVLIGLLAYLIVMNWLGFLVCTLIFGSIALISLGSRWWTALLSSLCIVVIVQILFVELFHVSLPTSVWGGF